MINYHYSLLLRCSPVQNCRSDFAFRSPNGKGPRPLSTRERRSTCRHTRGVLKCMWWFILTYTNGNGGPNELAHAKIRTLSLGELKIPQSMDSMEFIIVPMIVEGSKLVVLGLFALICLPWFVFPSSLTRACCL